MVIAFVSEVEFREHKVPFLITSDKRLLAEEAIGDAFFEIGIGVESDDAGELLS
jgi:hypothetical protein